MHEVDASFTPFYSSSAVAALRRLHLIETTIGGNELRARCLRYLKNQALTVDLNGARGGYELVVGCTDVTLPSNVGDTPIVIVQEGILDPPGLALDLVRRLPFLPRWLAGTAATGLSGRYERFCVASQGYKDLFVARGAPAERIVVTGIPNFDDCAAFLRNGFPYHGYALVCTSDSRETFKWHDRAAFIRRAIEIANYRRLIFKLHPNENVMRARREIARYAPHASVVADGPTAAMIANCSVLITEWSSVAFVGLALGKEVHSSHPRLELERCMPEQNRSASLRIARVCEEVLGRFSQATRNSQVAA